MKVIRWEHGKLFMLGPDGMKVNISLISKPLVPKDALGEGSRWTRLLHTGNAWGICGGTAER
jgi:hypothetical protein